MSPSFRTSILHFDSIDSTNLEAIRRARSGAPEGTCIVAREQTAGRGRLDRAWQSPKDAGLYLSVLLRPTLELQQWPLITLMAAVAVRTALQKACGLQADIKWPNDICVNERKLCGILAEAIETPSGAAVVLGIGINLIRTATLGELRATAISIEEANGEQPDVDALRQTLLDTIAADYEVVQTAGGAEHLIREWSAASSYAFDRHVRVTLDRESFIGTTRGLDNDGALRVETADGNLRIVRAGDVTSVRPTAAVESLLSYER